MNFNKALSILGLTSNYTEEELKKNYRQLVSKYHPDLYQNKSKKEIEKAEEKTKELNTAYEYLKKCLNDRKTSSNSNEYSTRSAFNKIVNDYRDRLKKELERIKNEIYQINDTNEPLLKEVKEKILLIIKNNNLDNGYTINELNQIYKTTKENINKELKKYAENYCKKYNLNYNESFPKFDTLKTLHKFLVQHKKITALLNLINKEYIKYEYYSGYDILFEELFKVKSKVYFKYARKIENGLLTDSEEILKEINEALLKVFEDYYSRLSTLNELKEKYKSATDSEIIRILKLLEEKIADPSTFNMLLQNLKNHTERRLPSTSHKITDEDYKSFLKHLKSKKEQYNNNYIYNKDEEIFKHKIKKL